MLDDVLVGFVDFSLSIHMQSSKEALACELNTCKAKVQVNPNLESLWSTCQVKMESPAVCVFFGRV